MVMMTRLVTACAIVAGLAASAMAQTTATTNMEILRQKVKADKKLVVAANLQLTDAEGTAFWPVYEAYQKDLQQLNQRMTAMIESVRQRLQQRADCQRRGEEAARRECGDRRRRGESEERAGAQGDGRPARRQGGPLHPDREQDSGSHPLRAGRRHPAGPIDSGRPPARLVSNACAGDRPGPDGRTRDQCGGPVARFGHGRVPVRHGDRGHERRRRDCGGGPGHSVCGRSATRSRAASSWWRRCRW